MKLRIFKPAIAALTICLAATTLLCRAQANAAQPVQAIDTATQPAIISGVMVSANPPVISADVNTSALKVHLHELKTELKNLSVNANAQVAIAMKELAAIKVNVKTSVPQIEISDNDKWNESDDNYTAGKANNNEAGQSKTYSKIYPADDGDQLAIDNQFGNIVVNTWDKNQFKVDVQIKVVAGSPEEAQKLLDNVNISDVKDGSTVAFRTDISKANGSWLSWLSGGERPGHKIQIDYTVYMPAKNELAINNSYGAITLPDLNAKVSVNCAYGSLSAGSLNNESTIRASYSNLKLGKLDATWIDISYGSLNIGSVNKIWSNASYTGVKIDKIHQSGAFNIRYASSFSIGDLDRSMNNLAINASYSNIAIGLSGDENINFNISLRYGDFDYGNRTITFTDKTPDDGKPHTTKNYKGALGQGSPDKNIAINSSFGNITFNN